MPNTRQSLLFPLALAALASLSACSSLMQPRHSLIQIGSVRGGEISLLPETRNPVLVVNSSKGIGRAHLQILQPLPEGMIIEFPGLKQLELFSLKKNGKALICHGTAEPELSCVWGNEWPVAIMKRYPGGMTVSIPAAVFVDPGEWSLEWVDYYRH